MYGCDCQVSTILFILDLVVPLFHFVKFVIFVNFLTLDSLFAFSFFSKSIVVNKELITILFMFIFVLDMSAT